MLNERNVKQNFENFLIIKIFAQNYYNKSYVRNKTLDTYFNNYKYVIRKELGFSAHKTIYYHCHNRNFDLIFGSFLNKRILKKNSLQKKCKSLYGVSVHKSLGFITCSPRKGFIIYASGFFGRARFVNFRLAFHLKKNKKKMGDPSQSKRHFANIFFFAFFDQLFRPSANYFNCFRFSLIKSKPLSFFKFYKYAKKKKARAAVSKGRIKKKKKRSSRRLTKRRRRLKLAFLLTVTLKYTRSLIKLKRLRLK